MTIRLSTGLRNFLAAKGSLRKALQNGRIYYYSGSQPASADAAPTGTLLATFSASHAAQTAEVLATGTFTLTGGGSGNIATLTVNGIPILDTAVSFNTSLNQTAADLAAEINRHEGALNVKASASGATITLTAPRGSGASMNTWAIAFTGTTLTASSVAFSGGVAAVNGLRYDEVSGEPQKIAKLASQAWEATGLATSTAGWFRVVGGVADSLAADATGTEIRVDGSLGTSGADLNLSSTSISSGAIQSLDSFYIAVPANK